LTAFLVGRAPSRMIFRCCGSKMLGLTQIFDCGAPQNIAQKVLIWLRTFNIAQSQMQQLLH